MRQLLTSPVTKLDSLFNLVEERGVDRKALIKRAGLDSSILDSPDNRIALTQVKRLTNEALSITKDDHLGLHQGERFTSFSNILGYVMMTCRTLAQALDKFIRYQHICDGTTQVKLIQNSGIASLQLQIQDVGFEEDLHLLDYRLAGIYTYLKRLTGVDFDLDSVWFRHPAPYKTDEYKRIFKAQVEFNCSLNAINLNAEYLNLPLPAPNRELLKKFEEYAVQALNKIKSQKVYTDRVREVLLTQLKGNAPSINSVACELAMSVRNLQLKLQQESTSYSAILNEVRRELAMRYLHDQATPVDEIAYLLGYSEVSVFYRAFKRWTDLTPIKYRRNQP